MSSHRKLIILSSYPRKAGYATSRWLCRTAEYMYRYNEKYLLILMLVIVLDALV